MKNNAPRSLLERLEAHHQAGYLSLHMPGHKENTALAPYLAQLGAQWDITELPGFDDLHDPQDILAQAMDRAAKLWGSRKSWLQVNGSTGGLLAAIRAATRRGDQVLVARHCHKAIYHAIEVCGLEPIFLLSPVVEGLGIAGSLTPAQVALIGNVMMGQRYGWGGMFGDRDCSALTRELLTPFGIWLPRNSLSQARSGRRIMLDGMSIKEKEKAILRDGVPFLTLVWLRGHIMLYVGPYKGRPAIFHNVWGVRTVEGASDNERFVIGRAVVSSITPGSELRNLYRTTTFGDRVNSITVLGGR